MQEQQPIREHYYYQWYTYISMRYMATPHIAELGTEQPAKRHAAIDTRFGKTKRNDKCLCVSVSIQAHSRYIDTNTCTRMLYFRTAHMESQRRGITFTRKVVFIMSCICVMRTPFICLGTYVSDLFRWFLSSSVPIFDNLQFPREYEMIRWYCSNIDLISML